MARYKKITQNINKDVGLLDLPKVKVPHSLWDSRFSNYISCNIGEIVPIYCEEIMPDEKRRITMGMLSHMTTPVAPIFNAQYTEFRAFFVPHRLSADLLAGYKTRKSPWVKVFGEDNASASANIIVPLSSQKLPDVSTSFVASINTATLKPFGGILDALDLEATSISNSTSRFYYYRIFNYLNLASYELIYQSKYRNQNRESATNSNLYKFLFDGYNRTSSINFDDSFHIAQREKDYFTGSQPFTQKGDPVSVGLVGNAPIIAQNTSALDDNGDSVVGFSVSSADSGSKSNLYNNGIIYKKSTTVIDGVEQLEENGPAHIYADLSSATGVNIEQLRLMIKTQELLEKDMMYGSDYASSLNSHFGTAPLSEVLNEPWEIKKVTITSQMQAIFQTSSTASEQSILGTIGANATTNSGDFEIVPMTHFKEWGYLMICAVHKSQNSYDALYYKPKHLFKKSRFDFYTPELEDLGYQPVTRFEYNPNATTSPTSGASFSEPVSFNEAFAEYRYYFNRVHAMFEPSRANALDYWTLSMSNYSDIQSLYKQSTTELDRALSVASSSAPQFFDAYGFIEDNSKPMKLHSIPGFDGVI